MESLIQETKVYSFLDEEKMLFFLSEQFKSGNIVDVNISKQVDETSRGEEIEMFFVHITTSYL